MKYVAPAYLLVVLGGFIYYNMGPKLSEAASNPVALWTLALIGAVILLLIVLVAAGERRWRRAGLDLDGQQPLSEATEL